MANSSIARTQIIPNATYNKHTVSIAEAIHVPYRPQQISKRHNSRKNTWKDTKVKNCLYYVNTIHTPNLMSVSCKTTEKSAENIIFAKDNNSIKSRSKKKKRKKKLDLYYVKTNPYMKFQVNKTINDNKKKFQVNMSKDDKEKSGKVNFSKGQ